MISCTFVALNPSDIAIIEKEEPQQLLQHVGGGGWIVLLPPLPLSDTVLNSDHQSSFYFNSSMAL
jgi:hypothetical protein